MIREAHPRLEFSDAGSLMRFEPSPSYLRLSAFICGLIAFCITSSATAAITLRDDLGNEVKLEQPARRIVTLAPFLTELVFSAGAGERVVGVSAFSDYPPEAKEKAKKKLLAAAEKFGIEASGKSADHLDLLQLIADGESDFSPLPLLTHAEVTKSLTAALVDAMARVTSPTGSVAVSASLSAAAVPLCSEAMTCQSSSPEAEGEPSIRTVTGRVSAAVTIRPIRIQKDAAQAVATLMSGEWV